MDEAKFWTLVDASRATSQDKQEQKLTAEIRKLTPGEIADFEHHFAVQMRRAYTWDLWGAAYVINGGASDDGFEYFRRWLVSRGRAVFEAALKDPDSLASLIPKNEEEPADFESFASVAGEVWRAKTRVDPWTDPKAGFFRPEDSTDGGDPSGQPFDEDPDGLARRWPKLWKRFSDNPLGDS